MKFIQIKKFSILLNIFKYSFVGIFVVALLLPNLFVSSINNNKVDAATNPIIIAKDITNTTANLYATGLIPNSDIVIQVDDRGTPTPRYFESVLLKSDQSGKANASFINLNPLGQYRGGVGYSGTTNLTATVYFETTNFPPTVITDFNPSSGSADATIVINGQNLENAVEVLFHTTPTSPTIYSPTKIVVKVPNGAATGKITIKSVLPPNGTIINTVSTNNFTVTSSNTSPTITNINPTSGKIGDIVTITGENFMGLDKIIFNETPQTVTQSYTSTEIKVKVPAGTTDGKIKVVTSNGSGTSASNFTISSNGNVVTPPGPTDEGDQSSVYEYNGVKFKGLVPVCNQGAIDPKTGNYVNPCDFNMVMALVNKFINFLLITLATPLFALIIIYTGWLYLSDMGSVENVKKAKKIFKNAFLGYVIALAAWLIIKTILAGVGFDPHAAFLSF